MKKLIVIGVLIVAFTTKITGNVTQDNDSLTSLTDSVANAYALPHATKVPSVTAKEVLDLTIDDNRHVGKHSKKITITMKFDRDTVSFGDELNIALELKNLTDSTLVLCPAHEIMLTKVFPDYDDESERVFISPDWAPILISCKNHPMIELRSKETYVINATVKVESRMFFKGKVNKLFVFFNLGKCGNKKSKNNLCGEIKSPNTGLYVY